MKEYICKKNLLEHIHQRILTGNYQEPEDVYSDVDNFPTVTRADIVNDFCKWLKTKRFILNTTDEIVVNINDEWMCASEVYIAEIEQASVEEYDTREYAKQNPKWAEKIKILAEMEQQ